MTRYVRTRTTAVIHVAKSPVPLHDVADRTLCGKLIFMETCPMMVETYAHCDVCSAKV